jgi:hypothetical protein
MAQIFAAACGRATTISNASASLGKTGIHSFNPGVFPADNLIASIATDTPMRSADLTITGSDADINSANVKIELLPVVSQNDITEWIYSKDLVEPPDACAAAAFTSQIHPTANAAVGISPT